jgi:hypothetical protein
MPFETNKSVRGRNRGKDKSPKEIELEDKAKGHSHSQDDPASSSSDENNEERSSSPKMRGNQKGFGKNQGKEAGDRTASHGTRAEGSVHG